MKKDKIYIDTSIVGGFFDVEFEYETKKLFKRLENQEVIFVISDFFEKVYLTEEAKILGSKYVEERVVGETSIEDCFHIVLATIENVDVLASWNFKHIVNLQRIKGYNSVNIKNGYNLLEIRNPKDLINYED
ncbi:hypothetical protein [Marivirga sp.]|uniref:hypothetical protein n=1 Tax=Marivirga sp. TaxID=2018662 RepID=UPI003DA763EF